MWHGIYCIFFLHMLLLWSLTIVSDLLLHVTTLILVLLCYCCSFERNEEIYNLLHTYTYANVFGERKRYMNNYNDNNLEKKYWKSNRPYLTYWKRRWIKRHHITKRLLIIKEYRGIIMIVSRFISLLFFFYKVFFS